MRRTVTLQFKEGEEAAREIKKWLEKEILDAINR